jgi:hypothetical protein
MLTTAQQTTLANALKSETNAGVVSALAIRNDVFLADWCNGLSSSDAWNEAMTGRSLFEATDITKFNNSNFAQSNRDAWRLMLDFAPLDMSKNSNRKAVNDTWGTTDSVSVLQACTRKATRAESYLGGTSATTNTVTALKLNWTGSLTVNDVSMSLNANP